MLDAEPALVFVGTAGAGKSTLTAATETYLKQHDLDVLTVNLDPGARDLPYEPGVDIREFLTIEEVMDEYGLGPNGAQVAAADLVAVEFGRVEQQIDHYGPEVMLVDTPGQLELFAFRASGPYVTKQLSNNALMAFLMDPVVSSTARGFVSQAVLAATTHYRLQVPTLNILAKVDTLPDGKADEILRWATDSEALEDAVAAEGTGLVNQLNEAFVRVLHDFDALAKLAPVSATTLMGIEELYALTTQVVKAGENDLG